MVLDFLIYKLHMHVIASKRRGKTRKKQKESCLEIAVIMQQRIVIKVQLYGHKQTAKAMGIASATYGVNSIAIIGDAQDQLEVKGEGVDSVKLTGSIRKKVGRDASIVCVEDVNPQRDQQPPNQQAVIPQNQQAVIPLPAGLAISTTAIHNEAVYNPSPSTCSSL